MTTSFWRRGLQCVLGIVTAGAILAPSPAHAQITRVSNSEWNQAFGFKLGYFSLKGNDARGEDGDDVIFNNQDSLIFDLEDFNGATFGAEWLVALGPWMEAGADVSFYQRTVPSIYRDIIDESGFELEQDLKLRMVPVSGTFRFLPAGRGAVQPFVGGGVSIINWRYSETGEFVDLNGDLFRDSFVADGTEVAPLFLLGIRFAVGDAWLVGGEYRYQNAKGDTGGFEKGFLGDKIHLGGHNFNLGIHFRF
jgi:opacity protein-like surface antigen